MSEDKKYIWDDIELDDEEESFSKFTNEEESREDDFAAKFAEDDDFEQEVVSKQEKKNKRRRRRTFSTRLKVLSVLIILVVLILFIPFFKIDSVKVSNSDFLTKQDVADDLNIVEGEKYNLFNLLLFKVNLNNNAIVSYTSDYDLSSKELSFDIVELTPLAIVDGEMFYYTGTEIKSTSEYLYEAPELVNMDSSMSQSVISELSTLDYDIIKEIEEITNNENVINTDLLLMRMNDGNYVEINIKQISEKLPYYDQISETIAKEGNGPGIIHLNIGDYYEPI